MKNNLLNNKITFKEIPLKFKLCILASPLFLLFLSGLLIFSGCGSPQRSFVYGVKEYYAPIKVNYLEMLTNSKNPMFLDENGQRLDEEFISEMIQIHKDSLQGLEEFIAEAEMSLKDGE